MWLGFLLSSLACTPLDVCLGQRCSSSPLSHFSWEAASMVGLKCQDDPKLHVLALGGTSAAQILLSFCMQHKSGKRA